MLEIKVIIQENHRDHWMEPVSVTVERSREEKYCEKCGEDIPFHNNSCALLKLAHKNVKEKCTWCDEILKVGDETFEHNVLNHRREIELSGIKLSERAEILLKKTPKE